jgi:UDP-N-acetylmuramoyl-tripeptide--D-alanyl-D-alanine ligase
MDNSNFAPFYSSTGICTDTRNIQKDSLFICIKGQNFDGNTFSEQALKNGASHVIVDNKEFFTDTANMTLVEDSVTYLQELARHHRRKFDIPVIGITGSNGKTTSKELIHAVLSKKYNVLATIGNLNNHLGVPFTLLRLSSEHEIAIIEMGANRFKDIEELCAIAEPTHGIITNIGKAHLEGFGGFEGVLKTKRELYESVESIQGTVLINGDDTVLMDNAPNTPLLHYGEGENNKIQGKLVSLSPFVEMTWSYNDYQSSLLSTQMIGKYNFYNFLAAAAFGVHFKVPNEDISKALVEYTPTNNRSQVTKTERNTLIMDCYNANPTSMKSALESFAMIDHPKKLAIIGDMRELGEESEKEHKSISNLLQTLSINAVTVGTEFGKVQSEYIQQQFELTEEAKKFLKEQDLNNHLILLKGSRGIGLEVLKDIL